MSDKDLEKKETQQLTKKEEPLINIEILKERLKISDSIFYGVLAFKGWAKGKKVSETEMKKAVKEFLNAPLR
jgi:hypothetical protein